jgi:hypothetical protein
MRRALLSCLLVVAAACSRQVVVESAPQPSTDAMLSVTNRLSQAVNVYVVAGGTDNFLRQVGPNSTELIPVPAALSGTTAQLKARTADGTRTYTRDAVLLRDTVTWEIR